MKFRTAGVVCFYPASLDAIFDEKEEKPMENIKYVAVTMNKVCNGATVAVWGVSEAMKEKADEWTELLNKMPTRRDGLGWSKKQDDTSEWCIARECDLKVEIKTPKYVVVGIQDKARIRPGASVWLFGMRANAEADCALLNAGKRGNYVVSDKYTMMVGQANSATAAIIARSEDLIVFDYLKPDGERRVPEKFDGLTAAECLERYQYTSKAHDFAYDGPYWADKAYLTPIQLVAARAEWKRVLAEKVAATEAEDKRKSDAVVGWDPYGSAGD